MKEKKVIFCVRSMAMAGGKERAVSKIANQLVDQYDMQILSLSNTNDSFYDLHPNVSLKALNAMAFLGLGKRLTTCFLFFKSVRLIARFIRKERPSVLIGTDFVINTLLILARFLSRTEVHILGWEHLPLEEPIIAGRKRLLAFRNFFYRRLDQLVVLTKTDLEYSRQHHIRAQVIPNPKSFEVKDTANYEQKNILTIARLSYQKGLDLYLKVIDSIKDQLDGWQFILVTKEDDISLSTFQEGLKRYQLLEYVQICPPTPDVLTYYKQASIYLMTSRYEGLPITLIEAQTCGLPCVCFDCKTGPSDIISNGRDGYLIPAFEITRMAECLLLLMAKVSLRQQIGQAAKIASRRFDNDNIIKCWQKLLKNTGGYSKFAS